MKPAPTLFALSVLASALWAAAPADEERTGGDTTVFATGFNAFSIPAANLDEPGRTRFAIGNSFFRRNWVEAPSSTAARDGLGPRFIARSCGACHPMGGRGAPPVPGDAQPVALLFRLSVPGTDAHGGPKPEPHYGDQFRIAAIRGVPPDGRVEMSYAEQAGTFDDGTPYTLRVPRYGFVHLNYGPMAPDTMIGPRLAPQLIGLGLLEAIAEADVLAGAAEQATRSDGIRGVANRVWDAHAGRMLLGRFGWKANNGSLIHQTAAAFQADIGITSHLFPDQPCMPQQEACRAAPVGNGSRGVEIDDGTLADVAFNQATLAPPARRDVAAADVRRGGVLFAEAGCAVCHRPTWVTGTPPFLRFSSAALAGQVIHPYTDLLLHDMGEGLADGRPDFLAGGRQWRTPPLWGIGLIPEVNGHLSLLHDGRARGVLEAILWHGGEGDGARRRVLGMSAGERADLVRFVESL